MTTTTSLAETLTAVEELAPLIRESAAEAEQQRHLSDAVVDGLHEAGVYRFQMPRSLGGGESDPVSYYQLVEKLGSIDGSTAWCGFIGASAAILSQYLGDEAADEIWADPRALIAGGIWPFSPVQPEEGGYRVSGRWPYASGCRHATHLGGGAIVMDGDGPDPSKRVQGRGLV